MIARIVALFMVAALLPSPAAAAMLCGPYLQIRSLISQQKETLEYRGLGESGTVVVELYLRRPQHGGISYSLLVRSVTGLTCLIVSSFYFPPFEDRTDGS